jgi:sulfite exporter TauE/SafE
MCGGFVCFVAGQEGPRYAPLLLYHVGRWMSYVALGALAGALGYGMDRLGLMIGLTRGAAVLAGLTMITWGGLTLARSVGVRAPWLRVDNGLHRAVVPALRALATQPPLLRALSMGLLTTLLPCGWLYAFVATAAGTGSAVTGALVMAVFWIGTVPMLTGLGVLARGALGPLARRLPAATAAALIAIGLLTIAGKFQLAPHPQAASVAGAATSPTHVCH